MDKSLCFLTCWCWHEETHATLLRISWYPQKVMGFQKLTTGLECTGVQLSREESYSRPLQRRVYGVWWVAALSHQTDLSKCPTQCLQGS